MLEATLIEKADKRRASTARPCFEGGLLRVVPYIIGNVTGYERLERHSGGVSLDFGDGVAYVLQANTPTPRRHRPLRQGFARASKALARRA